MVNELAIGSIIGINICFGKNGVIWMLGEYKVINIWIGYMNVGGV